MTVVAGIFVPKVILYKMWAYSMFRAPVGAKETLEAQIRRK
jgi:hypothetical protein